MAARRWGVVSALLAAVLAAVLSAALVAARPAPAAASSVAVPLAETQPTPVVLTLFWGNGCPHCAAEEVVLKELEERYPQLQVQRYEVWYDATNRALFEQTAAGLGFEASGVPTTILGERYWIGFSDAIEVDIRAAVEAATAGRAGPSPAGSTSVDVPLVGQVQLAGQPLLVSTLVIGFVDGVNPCSLWVLSVLLAIVLHAGSRRRVFAVGSVFLLVTAALYALYVAGMYSALDFVSGTGWIRVVVAVVAGAFGLVHLKDYFRFKQGPSLSIPESSKPGLYQRMRGVASPDRSLPAVLAGTVVLAAGVSLLETPCTAGLPLLWTNLLASQDVALGAAAALFAVYLVVFLLDELVVFGLAVFSLRATKMQQRHGRALKLLSGTVMVALAVTMLVAPGLLESAVGALAVFLAAGAVVAVILLGARVRSHASA